MNSSKVLWVSSTLVLFSQLVACTSLEEGEKTQSLSTRDQIRRISEETARSRARTYQDNALELERHLANAGEQKRRDTLKIQRLSEENQRLREKRSLDQPQSVPGTTQVIVQIITPGPPPAPIPLTMPVRIIYYKAQPEEGDVLCLIPRGTSQEPVLRVSLRKETLNRDGFYLLPTVFQVPPGTYELVCYNAGRVRYQNGCAIVSRSPHRKVFLNRDGSRIAIPCDGNFILLSKPRSGRVVD